MEIGKLPGFDTDDEPYFDRLDEELDRLLSSIDAAANAMGVLLDLQLNERAYVVSLVATIFVPLTFVTGFFGMNFGWMVDQIDTPVAFWLLGLIVPIAAGALSWRFLVRRFVMGDDRPRDAAERSAAIALHGPRVRPAVQSTLLRTHAYSSGPGRIPTPEPQSEGRHMINSHRRQQAFRYSELLRWSAWASTTSSSTTEASTRRSRPSGRCSC